MPAKMNRRPDDGGYARGDETRNRILEAAIDVFGEFGFEGASTRVLAMKAQSNMAAIQYYFGSKLDLYLACAEHLADRAADGLRAAFALVDAIDLTSEKPALVEQLCDFFDLQTRYLYDSGETEHWVLFLAREQMAHESAAFDIIHARLTVPMVQRCARVVGAIIGHAEDDEETLLRTSMITSHALVLRINAKSTLRLLGWADLNGERSIRWRKIMREHLRGMLMSATSGPRELSVISLNV